MNEVMLIVVVVVLIIGVQLLVARLKKPLLNYVKIIAAIGILILIWVFGGDSSFGPKLILSALALTTLWREYFSLKKLQDNK